MINDLDGTITDMEEYSDSAAIDHPYTRTHFHSYNLLLYIRYPAHQLWKLCNVRCIIMVLVQVSLADRSMSVRNTPLHQFIVVPRNHSR
jgi:hypothetical protein